MALPLVAGAGCSLFLDGGDEYVFQRWLDPFDLLDGYVFARQQIFDTFPEFLSVGNDGVNSRSIECKFACREPAGLLRSYERLQRPFRLRNGGGAYGMPFTAKSRTQARPSPIRFLA